MKVGDTLSDSMRAKVIPAASACWQARSPIHDGDAATASPVALDRPCCAGVRSLTLLGLAACALRSWNRMTVCQRLVGRNRFGEERCGYCSS